MPPTFPHTAVQLSMDGRYKKKALWGVVAWFLSPVLALVPSLIVVSIFHGGHNSGEIAGTIFLLAAAAAFYFTFFWGGSNLAKAKGYSNGILVLGIFGPLAQIIILLLLLFGMEDRCPDPSRRRPAKHHRDESPVARVIRLRRNAFAANLFGCLGILVVVATILLHIHVANTPDDNGVVRLLIFLPSYGLVIWGCANWIKAKNWPDAVCLIGLLPLVVFFIPYFRLIYRLMPKAFPIGMALMPIIMIAVIAVLPDKSGLPKRKHRNR